MTHYSAEVSCELPHVLNRVQIVNTQHHREAHDVWHSGILLPVGKNVLCVTDTHIGRTANYDAYGKMSLWYHVHAYPPDSCYLLLELWLFNDTITRIRLFGDNLVVHK